MDYFSFIPNDIFYDICKNLDFKDIINLRRVNRGLRNKIDDLSNSGDVELGLDINENKDISKIITCKKFLLDFGKIKKLRLHINELINPYNVDAFFLFNNIRFIDNEPQGNHRSNFDKFRAIKIIAENYGFQRSHAFVSDYKTMNRGCDSNSDLEKLSDDEIVRNNNESKQENLIKLTTHLRLHCIDILNYYSDICNELKIDLSLNKLSTIDLFYIKYMNKKQQINLKNLTKLSIKSFRGHESLYFDKDLKLSESSILINLIKLNKQKIKYISLQYVYCSFNYIMKLVDGTELDYFQLVNNLSYKTKSLYDNEFTELNHDETQNKNYKFSSKQVSFIKVDFRLVYILLHRYIDLTKIEALSLININSKNYCVTELLNDLYFSSLKSLTCNHLNELLKSNFEFPKVFVELNLTSDILDLDSTSDIFAKGLKFTDNDSSSLRRITITVKIGLNDDYHKDLEHIVNLLINKYPSVDEIGFYLDKNLINKTVYDALALKYCNDGSKCDLHAIEKLHNIKIFITFT